MSYNNRRRSRRANSAIPGYDNMGYEHFHPASKGNSELEQYGIDSDFGSTPHQGPYSSGRPPASYGWTPDHPATTQQVMDDFGLRSAMERKAEKCIRIAEDQLGRNASQQDIEDLALRYMDLPNNQIRNKLASIMADDTVLRNTTNEMLEVGVDNLHDEVVSDEIIDDIGLDRISDRTAGKLHKMQINILNQNIDRLRDVLFYGDMPRDIVNTLERIKWTETLHMDVERWLSENASGMARWANDDVMSGYMAEDDVMSGHMAEDDVMGGHMSGHMADILAEEIENLKSANARLARQVRKLADDAVAQGTGYSVTDEELQEESVQPVKQASQRGIKRLANALSDFFAEEESQAEDDSILSTILADVEADQNEPRAFYEENLAEDGMTADEDQILAELMDEGSDTMGLDHDDSMMAEDPKLARIFEASETEAEETEAEESEAEEKETSKKASLNVKPRRVASNSVKTLGNISREASAGNDELSKLWESAPDVSKYFG